ncbi:rhs element Vgr protein [Arthrobacter sp. Hiyo8]|nr:rhs element Vgr protein [Arthrobacter sp. Hiyo8]
MRQLQGLPELIVTLGRRRLSTAETAAIISVQVLSSLARPVQCLISWRPGPGRSATARGGVDPAPGMRCAWNSVASALRFSWAK